mmetsp:Transcript_61855/g.70950  ORF Transcript_61855/g.70950 Transcript_61855/m.70950 type:complete len:175 (+) Transcript_61855:50-574(+)|eukprot:CAMPEP_0114997716 /NCGR_PEP_ID=MMETSP0216-20121206/15063_1 /TAXON_ID=223996 /ORGANISM="Protocruzia adherens, Strain Boccale" /LENGTH=174 /DNA_ID=CAMNT_0002362147 /DNA_START=34 /DNA_END=558 /DNA_ORIENTATION=+
MEVHQDSPSSIHKVAEEHDQLIAFAAFIEKRWIWVRNANREKFLDGFPQIEVIKAEMTSPHSARARLRFPVKSNFCDMFGYMGTGFATTLGDIVTIHVTASMLKRYDIKFVSVNIATHCVNLKPPGDKLDIFVETYDYNKNRAYSRAEFRRACDGLLLYTVTQMMKPLNPSPRL